MPADSGDTVRVLRGNGKTWLRHGDLRQSPAMNLPPTTCAISCHITTPPPRYSIAVADQSQVVAQKRARTSQITLSRTILPCATIILHRSTGRVLPKKWREEDLQGDRARAESSHSSSWCCLVGISSVETYRTLLTRFVGESAVGKVSRHGEIPTIAS